MSGATAFEAAGVLVETAPASILLSMSLKECIQDIIRDMVEVDKAVTHEEALLRPGLAIRVLD